MANEVDWIGTGSMTQWDRAGHKWQGNIGGIKRIGPDTWGGEWVVDDHRLIITITDRVNKIIDIWEMQPEQHWVGQFSQDENQYEVKGMLLNNNDRGYTAILELPPKAHKPNEEASKFTFPLNWNFFQLKSLHVTHVSYEGEWLIGNVEFDYVWLNKDGNFQQPFRTKINESFPVEWKIFSAQVHVWLDGPKLWFGATVTAPVKSGTDQFRTSIDLPPKPGI